MRVVMLVVTFISFTNSDKSILVDNPPEPILVDRVIDSLDDLEDIAEHIKIEEKNLKKLWSHILSNYGLYRNCLESDDFSAPRQSLPDFTRKARDRVNILRSHLAHVNDVYYVAGEPIEMEQERIMQHFKEMRQLLQYNLPSPRFTIPYRLTLDDLQCIQSSSSSMHFLYDREYLTPLKATSELSTQCRDVERLENELIKLKKSTRNQIRDLKKLWERFFQVVEENPLSVYNQMDK